MRTNVRKMATIAILSALSVVLLFLAGVLPTGRLAVVAIAGILPAAAVINYGISGGLYCFAVSSILGLLILPMKGPAIVYIAFLGSYPVIKSLIERIGKLPVEWLIKLLWFNIVLTVLYFALTELFLELLSDWAFGTVLLYIAGNVVFIIYDIGFTGLMSAYGDILKRRGK